MSRTATSRSELQLGLDALNASADRTERQRLIEKLIPIAHELAQRAGKSGITVANLRHYADGGQFRKRAEGSSVNARSARSGEGVGGGAPISASETIERSLPPAVTERQRQVGVGSHEPERQMGDARARGQKIADEYMAVDKLKKGQPLNERERRDAADYAFRHSTERPRQDTGT